MSRGADLPIELVWRYQRPEIRFRGFPGGRDDEVWARLLGVSAASYRSLLDAFAEEVRTSAAALATEPEVTAAVRALPAGRVVALGDSVTAERASWFEVLRAVCDLVRPDDRPTLLNAGVSGDGTAHALSRLDDDVVRQRPGLVVVALGVNDARRHGEAPTKPLTGRDEFAANLREICLTVRRETAARLVLVTPTPVVEPLLDEQPFGSAVAWRNADVDERAAEVRALGRELGVAVADVHDAFRARAGEQLFRHDGLHPGAAGQRLILRTVVPLLSTADGGGR